MSQTEIFDFCTAIKYAALGKRVSMVSWSQGTYVYFDSENYNICTIKGYC